jgi:anionic cell wall polymer biosynthesis LytR-Cps2A-Psr (LCP) family protein
MKNKLGEINLTHLETTIRGLLEEFNLNEKTRNELLKFILAGQSLERYGKISDSTKANIKSRIESNEYIRDALITISKAKLKSQEKPSDQKSNINEEIVNILIKLKIKDSIRESLLKDILNKGISAVETSDIAPKNKTGNSIIAISFG